MPGGFGGVTVAVTALESFRIELDHLLADADEVTRSFAIRFLHLQRSIVADSAVRERWISAYSKGEIACENWEPVTSHGIFAFKAVGEAE